MPKCVEGCVCKKHVQRIRTKHALDCDCSRCYDTRHKRVFHRRGSAKAQMCIECGVTAQEWAHTHGSDPNLPDNYRPMCRKCHRKYDGWGEMISKAKTAYWATIPPEERNRDPETRRKNSEAQKARWAAMSPERRKSVIENAAEGQRRRNRSMRGAE